MLLCRRLHLVAPLRMCPRGRLISWSPRYLLAWQCRRLPTVFTPRLWMLQCRRSHTVLCFSTFLHRWVLAQLPRFPVDVFVQTPIRSTVLHDVAIQLPITEFFIGCIFSSDPLDRQNFVRQSPPSVQGPRALLQPPPGLEQLAPPSGVATGSHLYTTQWRLGIGCIHCQKTPPLQQCAEQGSPRPILVLSGPFVDVPRG